MKNSWTIHEVTRACGVTRDELNQWISRGVFRPSEPTRRGTWRRFDCCDLACLSTMAALRRMDLSVSAAGRIAADLRAALTRMDKIREPQGLFIIATDPWDAEAREPARLTHRAELTTEMLTAAAAVMVDVAKVYRDARAAISGRPARNRADVACVRPTGATTKDAAP